MDYTFKCSFVFSS